ncbi:MAG: hypothetical protein V1926_02855 [Candidatus Peregrinibacteria bacterium]
MATCTQYSSAFEITKDDLAFYEKVSPVFCGKKELIPPPTLCPDCRQQRRLAFRNERSLYHRKCDLTGKQIIAMYSPEKPCTVYDRSAWWGDGWDPLSFGRDFDFSRPFFEQCAELLLAVPRMNLNNEEPENSEYCNFAVKNKNCHLLFGGLENEDCLYSNRILYSRNCCDCSGVERCELCYECVDCQQCYHCRSLQNCSNSFDCFLGYDLRGCRNCFGCFGLQNASFCIGNKQYAEADYSKAIASITENFESMKGNFDAHKRTLPRKYMDAINAVDCTGNAILHSKHARDCFEVMNLQDCRFLCNATFMKDSYDINNDDHSELIYEAIGSETNSMDLFCDICWYDRDLTYCSLCFHSQNLFGCVGLKRAKYCILNKQYTKEEYEGLVPKIIDHMRKTGEWGEFFPIPLSPFAYNESMAQDYYPLTQNIAEHSGWSWKGEEEQKQYLGPDYVVPGTIAEVDDDITKQILRCSVTGKPYRIVPQELTFYRSLGIPVPRKCPDQRHKERMALRNPRKLWNRQCAKCHKPIATSYAPERPEIVYCEQCYLSSVY